MSNFLVKNKQSSILDLSAVQDVHGAVITLRPRGEKGDAREVTAAVANGEIVMRVRRAGWVDVVPATTPVVAEAPPAPAPMPVPAAVEPPPAAPATEPAPAAVEPPPAAPAPAPAADPVAPSLPATEVKASKGRK